jgi:hypothetical protein
MRQTRRSCCRRSPHSEVRRRHGVSSPDTEARTGDGGRRAAEAQRRGALCAKEKNAKKMKRNGQLRLYKREKVGVEPLGRGGSPHGPRRFAPWATTWRRNTRAKTEATRRRTRDPEKVVGSAAVH